MSGSFNRKNNQEHGNGTEKVKYQQKQTKEEWER